MKLLSTALKYYGQKEVDGPESNPWILRIIKKMFPSANDDSKVSWCSVFMHAICEEAGIYIPKDPRSGTARSWLEFGTPIEIDKAEPGDVVIFWRESPSSWKGHVALWVNDRGNGTVRVLGGNQDNAVNIRSYGKDRILGVRRLG